jgi:hypothetical protein
MPFKHNDRVIVLPHEAWPDGATGTVQGPIDFVLALTKNSDPFDGVTRSVQGRHGIIEFVWVVFDEPADDRTDDGPYKGGEVESKYVRHMD